MPRSIDWICISPKLGSETVQTSGDELKLVWPQQGSDWAAMEQWDFDNHLLQPMDARSDDVTSAANFTGGNSFCSRNPTWRLSLQTHKILGLA